MEYDFILTNPESLLNDLYELHYQYSKKNNQYIASKKELFNIYGHLWYHFGKIAELENVRFGIDNREKRIVVDNRISYILINGENINERLQKALIYFYVDLLDANITKSNYYELIDTEI